MMLRNSCQALVEKEFETEVISPYHKMAPPEVRSPMANSENQTDEFPFICCQGTVTSRGRPAKERHRMLVLEENGPEAVRRGVALDDERPCEVRQGEYWSRGDRRLEGGEGCCRLRRPGEPVLAKEGRQGRGNHAKLPDKLAVVPRKTEEPPDRARRAWLRPLGHCLHLGGIHGHPCS